MATTTPSRWIICPECEGDGKTSRHLGVINRDDWDADELEGYFNGAYDRPCECCRGTGKIRANDYDDYTDDRAQAREEYRLRCAEDGRRFDWNG